MLLLNLIPLIDVTFSTPTPDFANRFGSLKGPQEIGIQRALKAGRGTIHCSSTTRIF
jgi:hypothetical protein